MDRKDLIRLSSSRIFAEILHCEFNGGFIMRPEDDYVEEAARKAFFMASAFVDTIEHLLSDEDAPLFAGPGNTKEKDS